MPAIEVPEAEMVLVPAAPPVGTEMVTVPFPTPTLAPPMPENARTLLKVPEELEVVFPLAEREMVEKLVTLGVEAEIVRLPAPTPMLMIPAPEILKRFENVPEELTVVLPRAVSDTEEV